MTELITVLDCTYVNTAEGKPAEFIGLWYWDENVPHDESKARLMLFSLDRADILCLENGDIGTLAQNGERWEFIPRSN